MTKRRLALACASLAAGLLACAPPPAQTVQGPGRYAMTGMVLGVEGDSQFLIGHDAIKNLMPAMTMTIHVAAPPAGLAAGDEIRGTLVITADASRIEDVVVTGHTAMEPAKTNAGVWTGPIGQEVPDAALVNQDGRPLQLRSLRGSPVLITFIYTSCPLPDYCPLTMKRLETVRHAFRDDGKTGPLHLVGVSFDPEHDTPPVLKKYGEAFIKGNDRFAQWDLVTGPPDEVARFTAFFGVQYKREGAEIAHSMVTALIDRDGRVAKVWPGNSWQPDEVVAEVRRLGAER